MNRIIGLIGPFLCIAVSLLAQAPAPQPPPAQTPPPPATPPIFLEERAYVRRFSAGVTINFTPLNLFPKETLVEQIPGTTPVELVSNVDPLSNRVGYALLLQYAVNERWAIAVNPTYRKMGLHAFIQRYEGIDNSSTILDERARFDINEDTTARLFEIPILARYYTKDRHEGGGRWFFEAGPLFRLTQKVRTERDTVPPTGGRIKDNIPLEFRKNSYGAVIGIGGQLIDDFGIRAIPEVRYGYWLTRPFDDIHGRTRKSQLEFVFTLSF